MNELKAIARDLGVEPTGDRRKRETWEQAIEQHQLSPVPQSSDTSVASLGVDRVQEPIAQAANFVPGVEVDRSPVLSEGLLFLIGSWLVVSLPRLRSFTLDEPPDPHDFESLDVFHEAIALWDSQHPDISFDSFTYWAPCPDDWYEPAGAENFPGVDHIQAFLESSSTSDFFIPVFERDRPDEPPTAGVGARLPKPKPPSFPPTHTKRISNAYQTHSCFVGATAGYSGRSPPGGDGMA